MTHGAELQCRNMATAVLMAQVHRLSYISTALYSFCTNAKIHAGSRGRTLRYVLNLQSIRHGTPEKHARTRRQQITRMPHSSLPPDVISLPETLTKFREHAQKGNYALAQRYHEQVGGCRFLTTQRYTDTMSEELAGLVWSKIVE